MNKQTNTAALSDALPPKRMLDRHRPTGIALYGYNEDDMRAFRAEGVAAERERCAMKLQVTRADVSLAAAELSAQEWRTCAAVLRWMQARIRA